MKVTHISVLSAILILASAVGCGAQDYGKQLDKTWQQIFKIDNKDGIYRWSGYPVDNFGILTAYDPPTSKDWADSDRICATWRCIDRETQIPADHDARLRVANFVDVGGGGSVTLNDKQQSKIGLSLLLPGLAQLLNLKAGLDWSKGVTTKVTIDKAYKRSADRNKYATFIANQSKNQVLKSQYTNGRLAWIASDIVAEGITVEISIDKNKNASASAELTAAAGKTIPKESALNFAWSNLQNGGIQLTIKNPVVLAVQTRRQPGGGTLTESAGSDNVYQHPTPPVVFENFEPKPKK